MKYRYIFALCAASILAFSCQKEQSVPQETVLPESGNEAVTILTAGIEQTKTVLDGTSVLWKDGNKINVNGEESSALSLAVPSASAEFTLGVISLPYKALYPASAYTSASTLTLPYTQEYTAGSFADGAAAMYAYTTEGNNLSFHHLTCIVKVSVTRASSDPDTHDIKYVEFRSKGAEKVSGLFSIDYTTGELTPSGAAGDTDNAVRVTGSVSTASGADFYIAVPANTYASGFTVKVCDTEGHYMEKSKDASTALEAGHIHPMAAFEFVPTRTEVETIIITSAAELTTFATNWNSGAYSDADPFTVQLGNDITFTSEEAAAFPGIGTWEKGFSVTFDGQNHTISGYNASVPLFTRTESSSTVKDFTLNGTMSTKPSEAHDVPGADTFESYLGSVSGYHRGTISGVTSNVNIEINERTFEDPSKTYLCIGGLVGKMVSTSSVTGSNYGGTLTDADDFTGSPRVYVGGIVGQQNNKNSSVTECQLLPDGKIELDATLSSSAVRYNVGGISGRMDPGQINDSTNNGTVEVSVTDGITGGTYTYVGGICGATSAESSYGGLCNNGAVIININGYKATQPLAAGGIIGSNSIDLDGSENITNTSSSSVTIKATGAWDAFTKDVNLGGIFGRNSAVVSGLTNKGLVTYQDTDTDGTIIGDNLYMGGVIGAQTAETVSYCSNEGEIFFDVFRGEERIYDAIYYGGVIGGSTDAVTIDNCSNAASGYVHGGISKLSTASSDGVSYVGGVAGYVKNASVIQNCTNLGAVTNRQYSTAKASSSSFAVPYVGGIVGGAQGTSTNRATITGCSVPSTSKYVNSLRGATGGIVGYLQYADINSCSFDTSIYNQTNPDYNSGAFYIGGICGLSSYGTITSCTADTYLRSGNVYYIGGIAALGYNGTVIDGCHFSGTVHTSDNVKSDGGIGAITGFVQKSGTNKGTIKNCTFKGTLAGYPMTEPGAEGTSVSGTKTGIGIGNGTLDNNHLAD